MPGGEGERGRARGHCELHNILFANSVLAIHVQLHVHPHPVTHAPINTPRAILYCPIFPQVLLFIRPARETFYMQGCI